MLCVCLLWFISVCHLWQEIKAYLFLVDYCWFQKLFKHISRIFAEEDFIDAVCNNTMQYKNASLCISKLITRYVMKMSAISFILLYMA